MRVLFNSRTWAIRSSSRAHRHGVPRRRRPIVARRPVTAKEVEELHHSSRKAAPSRDVAAKTAGLAVETYADSRLIYALNIRWIQNQLSTCPDGQHESAYVYAFSNSSSLSLSRDGVGERASTVGRTGRSAEFAIAWFMMLHAQTLHGTGISMP